MVDWFGFIARYVLRRPDKKFADRLVTIIVIVLGREHKVAAAVTGVETNRSNSFATVVGRGRNAGGPNLFDHHDVAQRIAFKRRPKLVHVRHDARDNIGLNVLEELWLMSETRR